MSAKHLVSAFAVLVSLARPSEAAPPSLENSSRLCRTCVDCPMESTGTRIVRVKMYNQTRLNESAFATILEVANSIWAPYAISVEPTANPDAVTVVVSPGTLRGAADTPIAVGDTLFTKGHATPYIHLWLGAAELLALNSDVNGPPFTMKPVVERDAILLRMLGVALAHELGHYLLDSSDHSFGGLLRGTLTAAEMEHPKPEHLRLTRKQERMMCQRPRSQ